MKKVYEMILSKVMKIYTTIEVFIFNKNKKYNTILIKVKKDEYLRK